MAYAKRWYTDFYNWRSKTKWTVEIHERDYAGAASLMVLDAWPFDIQYPGDNKLNTHLKGSECLINIKSRQSDDYSDLFTNDSRKFLVKIYKYVLSSTLYWTGYILPNQNVDGFGFIRDIQVVASDGLAGLKDELFIDTSTGLPYEGYDSILDILNICLLKTDLDLNVVSYINLVPEGLLPMGDTEDTLDQTFAKQTRFQDLLLNTVSCYDVIRELLKPFYARLIQSVGKWRIERIPELYDDDVKYREFTSAGASVGYGTETLAKATTYNDGSPLLVPTKDITIETLAGNKSVRVIQDFGRRNSVFLGYNLPENEFTPAIRHFTLSASSEWERAVYEGVNYFKCGSGTVADPDQYIETNAIEVDVNTETTTLRLTIKGGVRSSLTAVNVRVYLHIFTGSDYYYWNGTAWTNTYDANLWQMSFKVADYGQTEDHIFDIDPFPVAGNMKLRIYDNDGQPFFSELLFIETIQDVAIPVNIEVNNTVVNANNAEIPEDIVLLFNDAVGCDNDGVFYDGVLKSGGDDRTAPETTTWQHRDTGANDYRLRQWIAQNFIDNDGIAVFRGTLIGELDPHQVLKLHIADDRKFVMDVFSMHPRNGMITGEWIEVKAYSTTVSLTTATDKPSEIGSIQTQSNNQSYSGSGGGGGGGYTTPDNVRAGSQIVTSGTTTITFSSVFVSGYILKVWALTADGVDTGVTTSNVDANGFDATTDEDCTVYYQAIKTT